MADQTKPKQTISQQLADMKGGLRKIGQQISPRLGYFYILLLVCAVAYVVSTVNQTFDQSGTISSNVNSSQSAQDASTTDFTFSFDAATVAKVKALSSGAANMSVSLPAGRINPFSE
jgi:hypothetical protein